MNATIPRIEGADLGKLKDRMPDLSELELPKLETVGRTADDTIDRLLGRSRRSVWPWVATSIGLVALIGVVVGAFLWLRRPMLDQADLTPIEEPTSPGRAELDTLVEPDALAGVDQV